MIYKTIYLTIIIALFSIVSHAQTGVEYEVRYNASNCNYEAVAHVTEDFLNDDQFLGPSGFTIVVPAGTNAGEEINTTPVNDVDWDDNSPVDPVEDTGKGYHKFATNGQFLPSVYSAGDEILLFTFTLPEVTCTSDIRVFENGFDPNPRLSTFENSFQVGNRGEIYEGNRNNTLITLPAPTPAPATDCSSTEISLTSNLDANYSSCDDVTFNWSGPNSFTSSVADPSFAITNEAMQTGDYTVTISDRNGCSEARTVTVDAVACRALPVTMHSFIVRKDGDHGLLDWSTANELNNLHFEVESSNDGKIFNKIGVVLGSGTSSEKKTYEFTDREPYNGVNFYRLKQVDYNGEYEYSEVRTLDFRGESDIIVFPNPASDHIVINSISKEFEEDSKFQLFNELGQLVKSGKLSGPKSVSVSNLDNGMYVIRVLGNAQEILLNQKINILR